jgi:hypothetical protein
MGARPRREALRRNDGGGSSAAFSHRSKIFPADAIDARDRCIFRSVTSPALFPARHAQNFKPVVDLIGRGAQRARSTTLRATACSLRF